MPDADFELTLPDSGATDALGLALSKSFPGALEDCAVLYLYGELGAGKTTCARGLLRGLGVTGLIRSPTFTLIPPADVQLTLSYAEGGRSAALRADTALGKTWLHNLRLDTRLASYVSNLT
jgi:hypothetical protein